MLQKKGIWHYYVMVKTFNNTANTDLLGWPASFCLLAENNPDGLDITIAKNTTC